MSKYFSLHCLHGSIVFAVISIFSCQKDKTTEDNVNKHFNGNYSGAAVRIDKTCDIDPPTIGQDTTYFPSCNVSISNANNETFELNTDLGNYECIFSNNNSEFEFEKETYNGSFTDLTIDGKFNGDSITFFLYYWHAAQSGYGPCAQDWYSYSFSGKKQ